MTQQTPVEIADRKSRKRAGLLAIAALVFLAHVIVRPLLALPAAGTRVDLWAVVAGYWAAMATAMGLLAGPGFQGLSARTAVYVVVSSGIAVALLVFSGLEYRAHRDA